MSRCCLVLATALTIGLTLMSCGSNNYHCPPPALRLAYSDTGPDSTTSDYVVVEDYDEDCMRDYDFLAMLFRYLRTARTPRSIRFVSFYSSDDPMPKGTSIEWSTVGDKRRSLIAFFHILVSVDRVIVKEITVNLNRAAHPLVLDLTRATQKGGAVFDLSGRPMLCADSSGSAMR